MIDIICIIHKNYHLYEIQQEHWKRFDSVKDKFRILYADNSPEPWYDPERGKGCLRLNPISNFDGESHGTALDQMMKVAESDIVGIIDSDYFWLYTGIFDDVEKAFDSGQICYGAAGFYPDFQRVIDTLHPNRAGHLAPCTWGMFVDRKYAMEQTFVSSYYEGLQEKKETGWRLRQRMIDEKQPITVLPGFYPEEKWDDDELCAFGFNNRFDGIHLLKGSAMRAGLTEKIIPLVDRYWRG